MELRSLDELDLDLAWRRLMNRMRRYSDLPDRLPYEVLERVSATAPILEPSHHLRPIHLVMASKRSGTVRPFVRVSPVDLLLYQALVDQLAPDIESALGDRAIVLAYRQNLAGAEDQFEGSPSWSDFMASCRTELLHRPAGYALTADIASYFVYVSIEELERRLLEVSDRSTVVRDLGDVLRGWRELGVRGLPQGLAPSSALGNLFLRPVDEAMRAARVSYRRYMDDMWFFLDSFADSRQLQDQLERLLYRDGLGFGGDKLQIRRSATALGDARTAQELLGERREALRLELMPRGDDPYAEGDDFEFSEQEIDEVAVHSAHDELVNELRQGQYPAGVRSRVTEIYRELERGRDPHGLGDVPMILSRLPDLTPVAMRYLTRAKADDTGTVAASLLTITVGDRFHRDQEWIHICRTAMWFPARPHDELAGRMEEVARTHGHPLVRARALLAWGALSADDDFSLADELWPGTGSAWRPYLLLAVQRKAVTGRDDRYSRWSGEDRFLRDVADAVRDRPFNWRSL